MRKMRGPKQRRTCWFCTHGIEPDYKNCEVLRNYVSERGKILPKRTTANCAVHQRKTAREVKRARHIALLPFVAENIHT
ncbi:MAG: 30S ribosomal protein S18 [Chitinivibrionales bacterium]|nr:30S ribosomal protein S18 [Chitinivibrionales bacterium]